jgi:hypothetical protein
MLFGNKVLRGIFGSKREKVTGGWRKLRIEKLEIFTSHVILLG